MLTDLDIDLLVMKRELARSRGDMVLADQIRDELLSIVEGEYTVKLLDTGTGPFWYWSIRKPK